MADDRKQITVRVSPSQRDDWDEYAESHGFSARGQMIRRAVEFYNAKKNEDDDTGSGSDPIEQRVIDLEDTLDTIRLDLQDIRREQVNQSDMDDMLSMIDTVVNVRITQLLDDALTAEQRKEAMEDYYDGQFLEHMDSEEAEKLLQDAKDIVDREEGNTGGDR